MKTLALRKSLLRWTILVMFAAAATATADSPSAAGRWSGAIELPGQSLAVDIQLASLAGDAWTGTIDIPAQGARALALTGFRIERSAVRFSISGIPGDPTFEGAMSPDGSTISGQLRQAGQQYPFRLSRMESPTTPSGGRTAEVALTKKLPSRLFDPAFLKALAGQYELVDTPSLALEVSLEGSALLVRVGDRPLYRLDPYRETEFQFRELAGYGIRFVVDAKGAVDEVLFLEPDGAARATRKK